MPKWIAGNGTGPPSGASTTNFTDNSLNDHTTYEHVVTDYGTGSAVESIITAFYDFGSVVSLRTVKFSAYYASGQSTFSVQYSSDGTTWNNSFLQASQGGTGWYDYIIDFGQRTGNPVNARYVRVILGDTPSGGVIFE